MQVLSNLYIIYSTTTKEWPMISVIRDYVQKYVPEAKVDLDKWGNIYIIKGYSDNGYPTLACHLDQVQTIHSNDFEVREEDGKLYGWSEQNQQREGLGADDKNGIWICLKCLERSPRLKVFMAVGEEKGCIGSNRADMSFFSDSLYVLEPDCKGGQEREPRIPDELPISPSFFLTKPCQYPGAQSLELLSSLEFWDSLRILGILRSDYTISAKGN